MPEEPTSLHLARILRSGGEVSATGVIKVLEFERGRAEDRVTVHIPIDGPLAWRASVSSVAADEFWLSGSMQGTALIECARCLRPVAVAVDAPLGVLLRFDPSVAEPRTEIDEDDQEVLIFGRPLLELTPILGEVFSLALPWRALCRPDCQGLCTACGTNFNDLEPGVCALHRPDCPRFEQKESKSPFAELRDVLE